MGRTRRTVPVEFLELFNRAQVFSTTPGQNGWTIADTSAAGAPVYRIETENGVPYAALRLANTNEAENVCLAFGDVLALALARLGFFRFLFRISAFDAQTTLVAGLGSARNDTPDSVAVNAWARIEGSVSTTALLVETDDTVVDRDDIATGVTVGTDWVEVMIDTSQALDSRGSGVLFTINGNPVAEKTAFTFANAGATRQLQPLFQLQKASGTGVPEVHIALPEWKTVQRY